VDQSSFNGQKNLPTGRKQLALSKVEMGWANFLVMRRTHATLMKALGADGKLVTDQLGHSPDVSQNVYTRSTVESRLGIVSRLEKSLRVI
jgi:integrase